MKNPNKKNKISLIISICMMAAAAALLITAGIGGIGASLNYESKELKAHVEMFDIGVTLTEQGQPAAARDYVPNSSGKWTLSQKDLLAKLIPEGKDFQIGTTYEEKLAVQNSGNVNEYVRVTVYKYWVNQDGQKDPTLDPRLIDLAWDNLGSDWTIAHENNECTVLYYNKVLPSGYATSAFTKSLTVYIDDTVMSDYEVKESPDKKSIEYTYRYDGSSFQIEVEVDAVQEHNAADAIMSAWGIPAAVSGGTLSVQPY